MEDKESRELRMQNTPAYKKAMKKKENDSATYKSQKRTFAAMKDFLVTVGERNKKSGFREKLFTDENELRQECSEYLTYCMEHEIIPTWNLLSVWLNCNPETLYSVVNLDDTRSKTLQKTRSILFTILEQITLEREGNPAAPIFFMKSLWGLSDQQPIDVNVNFNGPKATYEPEKIEDMIELAPDDYKEKT